MHVAYVCADPGVPVFSTKGCSVHVQEVLHAFCDRGFSVDLFAHNTGGEVPDRLARVRVHQLATPTNGRSQDREQSLIQANDVLHEKLWDTGPFDLVYERYALWSWRGMEYAKQYGVPGVLEANAPLIEEQTTYRELLDRRSAVEASGRVMAAASVVACVSAPVADYARQHGASGNVQVVCNGVDPHRFTPRLASQLGTDNFTIGFVGSLRPWHALNDLLRAFATLHSKQPTTRLLVVGDGPQRESFVRQIQTLPLATRQAVTTTGVVPPAKVPDLLRTMDVAVAPYRHSPDFYFSPLKLFEYMAAGLPVVASSVGQIPSVISHEENGLLYPAGDVVALVSCLQQLVGDAGLREQLAQAARQTILHQYTWEAVVDRILALADTTSTVLHNPRSTRQ